MKASRLIFFCVCAGVAIRQSIYTGFFFVCAGVAIRQSIYTGGWNRD